MTDHRKDVPHEYGPSTVGHGETQCVWCRGTNREIAIISPNHCKQRAQAISEPTYSVGAGVLAMDSIEVTQADLHEAAEIGERDGYEEAVQDIDIATGGDGEFFASTCGKSVDVVVMKQRIIDRIQSTTDLQAKLGAAVAVLSEVDDTLDKLSGALAELDAALFAQEIAAIAQDRESIAAIKGANHE